MARRSLFKNREESRLRSGALPLLCLLLAASAASAQEPSPSPGGVVGGFIAGFTGTYSEPSGPGAPPPPANASNVVTFNDSFTDESKIASREGVEIHRGNVTLSGRVANPSFESDGEWALRTTGNYTGAPQSLWATRGVRSYRLWSSGARTAGDGAEVHQAVNFTGASELRFDLRTSPRMPFQTLRVFAGDTTLWTKTGDPQDRDLFEVEAVRVPLPASLTGELELRFRLEATSNVSGGNTTEVGVEIDNVVLSPEALRPRGSILSTPVETSPILSAFATGNGTGNLTLEMSNDNGTTWERGVWNAPVYFATSGNSFRYRLHLAPRVVREFNNTTNTTTTRTIPAEAYDVRFFLETTSTDFSLAFPRQVRVGEPVTVRADPDGLRYFFLATAPNGLPMNLTRTPTSFTFVPAVNGTYTLEVRASPLSGGSGAPNEMVTKRLALEALPNATPATAAARPPELEVSKEAAVVRVFSAPGAADYPVEVHYWVESGPQRLSPGVVGGKVEGALEFVIATSNLQVAPGSYRFAVQVLTPDGTHELRAPLTIAGVAGTAVSPLLLAGVGGGAAAGLAAFYLLFLRKRLAARKEEAAGGLPGMEPGEVEASLEAAAGFEALPSDTFVEPPPPFVGTSPTRLAKLAEAELPPPPVIQAEIPDWKPPPLLPSEPGPEAAPEPAPQPPGAPPPEGLEPLLLKRATLQRELKELEGYSVAMSGAKSAEEVRQVLEDRRRMRAKVRSALDAVEAQIRTLQGGAPEPARPAPPAQPPPVAEPPPSPPAEPPPHAEPAGSPSVPPAASRSEATAFESPLQAEIDKIEAELKRRKAARG